MLVDEWKPCKPLVLVDSNLATGDGWSLMNCLLLPTPSQVVLCVGKMK